MKIIERGIPPLKHPWIGRWKCYSCQSVIQLEESDADIRPTYNDDQRDGESVTIPCPVCQERRSMSRVRISDEGPGGRW